MNKEQGSTRRAWSWLGVWPLAAWMDSISVYEERLQGHRSYISLLKWRPSSSGVILGLKVVSAGCSLTLYPVGVDRMRSSGVHALGLGWGPMAGPWYPEGGRLIGQSPLPTCGILFFVHGIPEIGSPEWHWYTDFRWLKFLCRWDSPKHIFPWAPYTWRIALHSYTGSRARLELSTKVEIAQRFKSSKQISLEIHSAFLSTYQDLLALWMQLSVLFGSGKGILNDFFLNLWKIFKKHKILAGDSLSSDEYRVFSNCSEIKHGFWRVLDNTAGHISHHRAWCHVTRSPCIGKSLVINVSL